MNSGVIAKGKFAGIKMARAKKVPAQFKRRVKAVPASESLLSNHLQSHNALKKKLQSKSVHFIAQKDEVLTIVDLVDRMDFGFKKAEDLDFASSSDVKNKWTSVMKSVAENGILAIRNRNEPQVVMMGAENFDSLVAAIDNERMLIERQRAAVLHDLNAKFERQFSTLQSPDHRENVNNLLDAFGKFPKPTKLGPVR